MKDNTCISKNCPKRLIFKQWQFFEGINFLKYVLKNCIATESDHTWLADEDDTEQYLQVDLGRQHPVYAISVRGNPLTVQFVTSYKVLFSTDGYTFAEATDLSGSPKV